MSKYATSLTLKEAKLLGLQMAGTLTTKQNLISLLCEELHFMF